MPLTVTASNGWSFLGWQGDASGTTNPLSVTVNGTNNIQAVFGTVVNTNPVGGGSIVLGEPNPVPYGKLLTVSAIPNAGQYFLAWSGAASGTNEPTTITVTNANPTVNALFSALPGGEFSLAVAVIGDGLVSANPQKRYYNPGDTVMLSATPRMPTALFTVGAQNASGSNNPLSVNMTTNMIIQAYFIGPPAVTISPLTTAIPASNNFVLTATASGFPPLSYQWQNSQGVISGATNATLAVTNAQVSDGGNYFVIVTNAFGSATSAVATVTVILAPSVTTQPQSQNVVAGTIAALTVTGTGTPPLNYQWVDSLGFIPGATNASLVLNPALTNEWDNYYVIITNAYGMVTSTVASLVIYVPVSISLQPGSLIVPLHATASFTVTAHGYPAPLYQWSLNGTNVAGATAGTITISNVSVADIGSYQAFITNNYSSTNSAVATLNVQPTITTPFHGATTTWGNSADLSVGAVGSGPLSYQWYFNGVAISGATGPDLDFTSIQFTNAGQYSVVVSSPYGAITNAAYQVIVNPAEISLAFSPSLTIGGTVGYSYIIQSSTNLAGYERMDYGHQSDLDPASADLGGYQRGCDVSLQFDGVLPRFAGTIKAFVPGHSSSIFCPLWPGRSQKPQFSALREDVLFLKFQRARYQIDPRKDRFCAPASRYAWGRG